MACLRKDWLSWAAFAVLGCVLTNTWANARRNDLISAVGSGDLSRVKALLAAGADVNVKDREGFTALFNAPNVEVLRVLLGAKPDLNAKDRDGDTALARFIRLSGNSWTWAVPALLVAGADPNARASDWFTPLMWAAMGGNLDVVRALLDAKADANAKAGGFTVAEYAYGHEDAMLMLRHAGPDRLTGFTALMMASANGRQEVVKALLDAKADVNARAGDGTTALIMAIQNNHPEVAQLLRSAGAQ
jgi:serine/threonine-protein phosphatase 6 regulatory ankyrin repeat subunit B